jgi:hypothetical protein
MREDGAELRLVRRACSRLHLDQNRPHSLGHTCARIEGRELGAHFLLTQIFI